MFGLDRVDSIFFCGVVFLAGFALAVHIIERGKRR